MKKPSEYKSKDGKPLSPERLKAVKKMLRTRGDKPTGWHTNPEAAAKFRETMYERGYWVRPEVKAAQLAAKRGETQQTAQEAPGEPQAAATAPEPPAAPADAPASAKRRTWSAATRARHAATIARKQAENRRKIAEFVESKMGKKKAKKNGADVEHRELVEVFGQRPAAGVTHAGIVEAFLQPELMERAGPVVAVPVNLRQAGYLIQLLLKDAEGRQ